ncbi:MAG: NAD-dependent epimerase/dehydratase family protein, partial [SAR202 cluster bacterium]|nr:NAD-dependent epimerase/dehydratase family protein [SAR202 cluster bacterium]
YIWPYSEARGLRSRMREFCTSGSAGGPGGVIPWGYPTYISFDAAVDMILSDEAQARTLMSALQDVVPRVVAVSSQDVYRAYGILHRRESGPLQPLPLTEDSALREELCILSIDEAAQLQERIPWVTKDDEKILVERVVMRDPDLSGTVVRLPAVYGPGDPQHRLHSSLKRMDDDRPAILMDEAMRDWRWSRGYVEDVAQGIALAATEEKAAGRIYNVCEPDALSQAQWVRAIGDVAGWSGEIISAPFDNLPDHLKSPNNYAQDWVVDSTRIRTELGYAESLPRSEALARAIAWERANPPPNIDPLRFDYEAEDRALERLGR